MKGQSAFFKTVCALAVPAALQSMLQSSFGMVDLSQIDFKGCTADIDFCVTFARAAGIKVK